MHGPAFAIDEELPQRVVPDHTVHREGLHFIAKPQGDHFGLAVLELGSGGLAAVLEGVRRIKRGLVQIITQRPLGQTMIGGGPFLELHGMASLARGIPCIPGKGRGFILHDRARRKLGRGGDCGWCGHRRKLGRLRAIPNGCHHGEANAQNEPRRA